MICPQGHKTYIRLTEPDAQGHCVSRQWCPMCAVAYLSRDCTYEPMRFETPEERSSRRARFNQSGVK